MKINGSKLFSIGGSILLTLATETITISYYWRMLSGIATVAILGLLFVGYVLLWSSYWYAAEENDKRVRYTALGVAFFLSVMMAINSAVVLVNFNKEKSETSKAKANIVASRERADETIRIQKETGNWRAVREHQQAETERAKIEAEKEKNKEKVVLPGEEDELQLWIDRYSKFWIFLAPFLCGVLGKFALAFAIALPGGAEFGRPTSRQPLPVGSTPNPPTPEPTNSTNPDPPSRTPISRFGPRGGSGPTKNS
jgi:hypothetical protein